MAESTLPVSRFRATRSRRRTSRGVVLIFSLLALLVLTFTALALVRSVNTGALVIGNLALKQDATASSDLAAEDAIDWLTVNAGSTILNANATANGYYATAYPNLDPTNRTPTVTARAVVDWDGDSCASYVSGSFTGGCLAPTTSVALGNKGAGNDASSGTVVISAKYVVTRLCNSALAPDNATNVCSFPLVNTTSTSIVRGALDYQTSARFSAASASPYFRIVVRTVGARNTVTYTETIVHY